MTDQKTAVSKPAWTRCPGCKDRIYNDKLDIGIHKGHCPADLMRRMQKIEGALKRLDERVDGLDEQVSAEPAVDLDDIAEWDDTDVDAVPVPDLETSDDDEGTDLEVESEDVAGIPSGQYYADEDEPDYGSTVPVQRLV